ncbi:hypothetical protein [Defluviimonas salinarum]|uniref:hypothetical protein n=1 Tax=Defluviimonas salinarum TaxID=2992147 RepID=UPI00223198D3|nr:hypothetical protein [Defluviimonas salinarum]
MGNAFHQVAIRAMVRAGGENAERRFFRKPVEATAPAGAGRPSAGDRLHIDFQRLFKLPGKRVPMLVSMD